MTTDPLHTTTLVDAVATAGGWLALSAGGAIAAGTAVASLRRGFDGWLRRPRARRTAETQPSARRRRAGASAWRRQVGATAGLLTAAVSAATAANPSTAGATAESGAAANHTTVSGGAPQLRVVEDAPAVTDPAVDGPSATATPSTATPSTGAPSTGPVPTAAAPEAPPTSAPTLAAPPTLSPGAVPAATAGSLPEGNDATTPAPPAAPAAPPAAPAAPPASPAAITAPEASGRIHRVADGEHFWSIATEQLRTRLGRAPEDGEVVRYWMVLIDANRDRLADPADPDLIHPGLELLLPEVRPVT